MSPIVLLLALLACSLSGSNSSVLSLHEKRNFAGLGCMGVYDKAKFARLDRVCEECYQLFRESDVHTSCRANCFKNNYFTNCVDALLLQKDQQRLDTMVEELYGKRK